MRLWKYQAPMRARAWISSWLELPENRHLARCVDFFELQDALNEGHTDDCPLKVFPWIEPHLEVTDIFAEAKGWLEWKLNTRHSGDIL